MVSNFFVAFCSFVLCYVFHPSLKKFIFNLKYYASYIFFWIQRKRTKRTIPFDFNSNEPEAMGYGVLPEAALVELPRPLKPDINAVDGIEIGGVDSKGNVLKLKFSRRSDNNADVWLYLKTADGDVYHLPHQSDSANTNYIQSSKAFSCSDFLVEVLEPLRHWRFAYNGFLKKINCQLDNEENETSTVHLDFKWSPNFNHLAFPDDLSLSFKAMCVAKQDWNQKINFLSERFSEERLEQFGQLRGTIALDGHKPDELLLRGLKSRFHGVEDFTDLIGKFSIEAVLEDGLVIHLFGDVSKTSHKNFMYGYVQPSCNFMVHHLIDSDLDPFQLLDNEKGLAERLNIKLKAGLHDYRLQITKSCDELKVNEGAQSQICTKMWKVNVLLDGKNNGYGLVQISKESEVSGQYKFHGWGKNAVVTQWEPDLKTFKGLVVSFTDVECLSSQLVGGKGSSLAKLTQHVREKQFSLSNGVCVTKCAFEQFLSNNPQIVNAITELQKVVWKKSSGNPEELCQKLIKSIEQLSISSELNKELCRRLTLVFGSNWEDLRFAVRSSGIGIEDSEETSAAGQNETYLGVKGAQQICHSIVRCWASQFAYRSIEYKRQNGQLLNDGMGVVVQQMVPADVAGVLFTRDPVDGNPSKIFITCNYGLGESVVSGVSDPDTFTLSRTFDDKIAIQSKNLGTKTLAIKMSENGGTIEEQMSSDISHQFSLTDENALKLGNIAISLEKTFGGPRDIEWAISNGNIYLLQSRPITTLLAATDFEILHEFDTGLRADWEHSTTGNVGEVFPGCAHPLTLETVERAFDIVMQHSLTWKETTHRYDPIYTEIFHSQFNRVVFDRVQQKSWQLEEVKGSVTKAIEVAVYGRILDDEDIARKAINRYKDPPFTCKFNAVVASFKGFLSGKRRLDNYMKTFWNLSSPVEGFVDPRKAHQIIMTKFPEFSSVCNTHIDVSLESSIWNMMLFQFISKGANDLTPQHYQDFATLIGSCNGVESGNVPASLQELAKTIFNECSKFSKMDKNEALQWLLKDEGSSGKLYKQFLKRHGHRCYFEFDLAQTPWNADELKFVTVLQSLVKNSSDVSVNNSTKDLFDELNIKFSPIWKKVVKFVYQKCRDGICKRELAKSNVIKYVDILRKGYKDLAKLMVNEGFIPDEKLLFFMTNWEMSQLMEHRSPSIIKRAKHRQRLYPYMNQLQFPEMIDGCFNPVEDDSPEMANGHHTEVKGFPVCKGTTTARACVIVSYERCCEIQQGDVLITHCTDIAWSPYFPLLSGVVTEIGGLVSHGAVVAREFGLPCVVGAFNATKIFHTGDMVKLDANVGTIRKVD